MRNVARAASGRGPTALAGTRRGAAILVGAALVVFAIQSLGWPEGPGRDLESYLAVYVDFWHTNAVFPWEMLNRDARGAARRRGSARPRPARGSSSSSARSSSQAPSCSTRGPRSSSAAVRPCSWAAALVLYPGYGVVFHELATEIVFAAGFAVWTAVVVRAALRPSVWRFAGAGVATALIALTRPANQVFLVAAILPLALAGSVAGAARPRGGLRRGHRRPARRLGGDEPRGATTTSPSRADGRRACRSSGRSSSTTSSGPTTAPASRELAAASSATCSRPRAVPLVRDRSRDVLLDAAARASRRT